VAGRGALNPRYFGPRRSPGIHIAMPAVSPSLEYEVGAPLLERPIRQVNLRRCHTLLTQHIRVMSDLNDAPVVTAIEFEPALQLFRLYVLAKRVVVGRTSAFQAGFSSTKLCIVEQTASPAPGFAPKIVSPPTRLSIPCSIRCVSVYLNVRPAVALQYRQGTNPRRRDVNNPWL